jgi:hypothetical protein
MAKGQMGIEGFRIDFVLDFSSGLEMVCGRSVMLCGAVVNCVFVCSRHDEDPDFGLNDSASPKYSRTKGDQIRPDLTSINTLVESKPEQRAGFEYRCKPWFLGKFGFLAVRAPGSANHLTP